MKCWLGLQIFASYVSSVRGYSLVREYSGQTFFDRWDFYGGYDNLTQGEYSIHHSFCGVTVRNIVQAMLFGSTSPTQPVRGWHT
jgi:hypothetical protein